MIHYLRAAAQGENRERAEPLEPRTMGPVLVSHESSLAGVLVQMLSLREKHQLVHVAAHSPQGSAYKSSVSYQPLPWAFFVYNDTC